MERQESMIERRLRQNVATVEQQAARIADLEVELTAAHGELAAVEVERRGWQLSRETMRRLIRLVEEWERADCTSMTLECAEQVRAVLRGEEPRGWESREGWLVRRLARREGGE